MNNEQLNRMKSGQGFIAALDQSGGSTPKALKIYGIEETRYHNEEEMFDLIHSMRTRIVTSPAFTSEHILGAILFQQTMHRSIEGKPSADYLWDVKGVVPFLKIDKGLAEETDDVRLMKPIPDLVDILKDANEHHIFGTKMRSVILGASQKGIEAIVDQQFAFAKIISDAGLVPIIEPEVDINIKDKQEAEALLKAAIMNHLSSLHDDVIFKLSLPTVPDFYQELMAQPHVVRVVALSGGYPREQANRILALNHGMIASFSRALSEGLRDNQSDEEFNQCLLQSINEIAKASRT